MREDREISPRLKARIRSMRRSYLIWITAIGVSHATGQLLVIYFATNASHQNTLFIIFLVEIVAVLQLIGLGTNVVGLRQLNRFEREYANTT